jgi:hypothetical protein
MKLNLNGVEIELPNNAKVDVSEDGKKVKIDMPEAVEKIRVVEVGSTEGRIVERIKVVEKVCTLPHYPCCTLPHYPCNRPHYPYQPWTYTYPIYTSGTISGIGGSTTYGVASGGTTTWGSSNVTLTGTSGDASNT